MKAARYSIKSRFVPFPVLTFLFSVTVMDAEAQTLLTLYRSYLFDSYSHTLTVITHRGS